MSRNINELKQLWLETAKEIAESNLTIAENALQESTAVNNIQAAIMQMQSRFEQELNKKGVTNDEKSVIKENVKYWVSELMPDVFNTVSKEIKPRLNEQLIKKG